jgi:hypothetical protein
VIVISQSGVSGASGVSRDDLVLNEVVSLTLGSSAGVQRVRWRMVSRPAGSDAVLQNSTSFLCTFTPDVPGSYLIELATNEGRETQRRIAAVREDVGSISCRMPAAGERDEANWLVDGAPNTRGWAPELETWLRALRDLAEAGGGGGGGTNDASTLTTGILPDGRMPNLTGDVTTAEGSVATSIAPGAVTLAQMATLAADTIIGRASGSGSPQAIACTPAGRALLDDADAGAQRNTLGLGSAATQSTAAFDPAGAADAARELARNDIQDHANETLTHGISSFGASVVSGANAAAVRGTLGLAAVAATGSASDIGTGTLAAARIADGSLDPAKLADMPAGVVGRVAGGSGPASQLTAAQLTTLVQLFTSVLAGAVPASGGGTTNFLRADGTWAAPPGGGSGLTHPQVLARGLGS